MAISAKELEQLIEDRLGAMLLDRKVALVSGTGFWSVGPEPTAGLQRMVLSDGPAGVRGERWDERDPSLNTPTPVSLAATWDIKIVEQIGELLGDDARRKGVHVLLAPAINLQRSPAGGRNFEYFSEDPTLTGTLSAAFVRGVQSRGVAATLKHFVANDSETDRFVVDVQVDDRTLREVYLAPFLEGVNAGAWAVMAAYNLVAGQPMTESRLLQAILREEWGFDGVVMSDWYAVRTVDESGAGALDLAMPGPTTPWGLDDALLKAVEAGRVPKSALDEKVRRILRLGARVGVLDGVHPTTPAALKVETPSALRAAAREGMVLLKNDGTLPVMPTSGMRVAVLGPAALKARTLGGGSATVYPEYLVTPLDGIRMAVGDRALVEHEPALRFGTRHPLADWNEFRTATGEPGMLVRFLDANGTELGSEVRKNALFKWLGDFQHGLSRDRVTFVEVSGSTVAERSGEYSIGCSGTGVFAMSLNGVTEFDELLEVTDSTDPIEALIRPPQKMATLQLSAGDPLNLVVRHTVNHDALSTKVEIDLSSPELDGDGVERAVELATRADIAIVIVGTDAEVETESMDRSSLSLPGRQDELVRRVAKANPRTVVVLNSGAPVLAPWIDDVAAVLVAWFPGQEFGNALADVLFGDYEPGGRLPISWPSSWGPSQPTTIPESGRLEYLEGLDIGYRSKARVAHTAFPFGFGLGYTTWEFSEVTAEWESDAVVVRATVLNTGNRTGKFVGQIYASATESVLARPERWLAGWGVVRANAGESVPFDVRVPCGILEHFDAETGRYSLEDIAFQFALATSAGDPGISARLTR